MTNQFLPNKRECAFLLVGIVAGFGLFGLYAGDRLGARSQLKNVTMYAWPGPSQAKENVVDRSGDGMPEAWEMTMSPYTETTLEASLTDTNSTGKADSCSLKIGLGGLHGFSFLVAVVDTDGDGVFDGMRFSCNGAKNAPVSEYQDWNIDGFMDYYTDFTTKDSWIATGQEWLHVAKEIDLSKKRVTAERGKDIPEFEFTQGEWVEIPSSAAPAN